MRTTEITQHTKSVDDTSLVSRTEVQAKLERGCSKTLDCYHGPDDQAETLLLYTRPQGWGEKGYDLKAQHFNGELYYVAKNDKSKDGKSDGVHGSVKGSLSFKAPGGTVHISGDGTNVQADAKASTGGVSIDATFSGGCNLNIGKDGGGHDKGASDGPSGGKAQ